MQEDKRNPGTEIGVSSDARIRIKGRHKAVIKKKMPDGTIEITETPWEDNRVVDTAAVLFAGLLKKDTSYTDWGILQFACGEGLAAWDTGTPTPSMSQTTLVTEFFRKAPDYVAYMDVNPTPPPDYLPAVGQTHIIETRMTYEFTDGPASPGKWIREQALFGGDATATTDSGIAFNFFNHNKIFKDDSIELQLFFVHEISIIP